MEVLNHQTINEIKLAIIATIFFPYYLFTKYHIMIYHTGDGLAKAY